MSDERLKEHVPTPDDLEREAKRLARVRHLTLVRETASVLPLPERFREPEPEPRPAA